MYTHVHGERLYSVFWLDHHLGNIGIIIPPHHRPLLFQLVWQAQGLKNILQQSFYGAGVPLRGCAKLWGLNRDWDITSINSRTGGKFFPTGAWMFCVVCVYRACQQHHKQQLWWRHYWPGNITKMMMSLEHKWFMLCSPRNLKVNIWKI